MARHPQTGVQTFNSDWQKAVSWATSQGIGPESYLPVYQLDLTRMQTGGYKMGNAERNLAILAAHNPNQVTNVPQDNPNPTKIMSNAVSDVGKIATGVMGIFTGSFERQVYDSAKATFHAIQDPQSMRASTFGGTIGNWLNDTLLAYLPGAADIGTVLQKDPTLTGSAGAAALAQHPLLSVLDILPGAEGGLTGELGRALIKRGSIKAASEGGTSFLAKQAQAGTLMGELGKTTIGGKAGVVYNQGKTSLVEKMPVAARLQAIAARLGPGGSGVGPMIGDVAEHINNTSAMSGDMYTWLMDQPEAILRNLKPEDLERVQKILNTQRTEGGDIYEEAMKDPEFSPEAKDAIRAWMEGPHRFAVENELFAGNLRPTRSLSGEVGMWAPAGRGLKKVLKAKNVAEAFRRRALAKLDELAPHAARVEALDQMRQGSVDQFQEQVVTARQEVFQDPKLQRPLTKERATHRGAITGKVKEGPGRVRPRLSISRIEQVHAVVGEGGIADRFIEQVAKSSDADLILELAKAMKHRLSGWGPQSVDAAEHPALAELYATAQKFEMWARAMQRESDAIDRMIHGTEAGRKHYLEEQIAYRRRGLETIKHRHKNERHELDEGYRRAKSKALSTVAQKIRTINERRAYTIDLIEQEGDREARRMTAKVVDTQVMPKIRARIREVNQDAATQIKAAKRAHLTESKLRWTEYQRDSSRLVRKHYTELERAKRTIGKELKGMGDLLAEASHYGNAIRGYQEAVADNPADQYRDVFVALLHKHIRDAEDTTALMIATDEYLKHMPGITEKRLAELRSDPDVVAELADHHFAEITKQPLLDPEIAADAEEEMAEYRSTAHEELKTLIGQGFRVPYIPSATSFDEKLGRDSMAPVLGHGIPSTDMSKAKVWELTPHKNDFALGINKAVVQALQRDATIYLVEHYIRPMALTPEQVEQFLWVFKKPEERLRGGNIPHELQQLKAQDLGLDAFNPNDLFGFKLPRWGKTDVMYLPKPVVNALREFDKQRRRSLLGASNKLFRYSILGLSPRYTAHVVFGGTMMLALRSSPYALTMIGEAARALREGTLPNVISRENVEMGFESPINMLNRQAGKDQLSLVVGEHIGTVQKVAKGAAKPIHVIRALADINFRFVRYVRDMQAAIAYLDGAATVSRREAKVRVTDPETGKEVTVSSDRAVAQGQHHVEQVFGNLRRMSPLERQVAQSIMPFYGWQKHILGYVMSYPHDHPWRAMVLSQMAYHSSNDVPLAYPIRLQLLMFFGGPDKNGNTTAVDMRSLDPFRDVANYATLTGFFESLNPALAAIPAERFGPGFVWGSSSLYPNVTYDAFYGIQTSAPQGSWITALEQWVPQAGAVVQAANAAGGLRTEWQTNRNAAIKTMLESLNVPFVTPPVNLKQLAARGEMARFESAKNAALNAFQTGDFSGIQDYKTVPNPLNSAYQITPAELEQIYRQAQVATPGVAPIESLLPPPTPPGF